MIRHFEFGGIMGAGAVVMVAAQPAMAAPTQITNVQLNQTGGGIELVLQTQEGDRPQIFTVSHGNSLVADIINSQLTLSEGNGFFQNSPAPGIRSVMVSQLDGNSTRVTVTGDAAAPVGEVSQDRQGITLSFNPTAGETAQSPVPEAQTDDGQTAQLPTLAEDNAVSQAPTPAPQPSEQPPASPPSDVLVPNPDVVIDGVPVPGPTQSGVPPLLPRAIAPPVGDIAVSTADTAPPVIDLGTAERVPRLVLRNAPVRDVLSLLARAAGLNVAYIGEDPTAEGDQQAQAQPGGGIPEVRVSLDIENEPVQDVFNYVLRISGLEANRTGRTIFVGPRLPNAARQLLVRTLRLNQVNVGATLNFLVGLGAETAVSRERQVTSVSAVPVAQAAAQGATTAITQAQTTTEERIETQRVNYTDSTPILRGLQVIGDERTNSVTLVGSPQLVGVAIDQLAQLDVRRRQVAVNVRVIDVDLLGINRASTSFSFGIGDTQILGTNGVGVINFGTSAPAQTGITPETIGNTVVGAITGNDFDFTNRFLAQLQFAVTSGNAKILTDPTLVVQEGQTAEVQLTEEVVTNFEIETEGTGDDRTQTVTVETEPAGLILQVQIDRIDDNGFVALSVAPSISAPINVFETTVEGVDIQLTLLSERRVSSGQVRVRDGQTLVLSGIIQETDRTTVTKVPILGDIPILGALFRNTNRQNERQEVIVLLTPQILDDSDIATVGYRYTPGEEVQQILEERGVQQSPQ